MPKGTEVKSRTLPASTAVSESTLITVNGSVRKDPPVYNTPFGTQVTESEGHLWPPPKGSPGDYGGAFRTIKTSIAEPWFVDTNLSVMNSSGQTFLYKGAVWTGMPGSLFFPFPPSGESSNAHLEELGATAIARCEPTNSPANIATFLGEFLKDGIPKLGFDLWRDRTKKARDLYRAGSGDYLNAQFGWQPLINDVSDFASALVHAESVLAQFERDAGRRVRRKYFFPSETKNDPDRAYLTVGNNHAGGPSTSFMIAPSVGAFNVSRQTTRKIWFSGCFTYALPSGYDSRKALLRKSERANYLLGLNLTPEVLWNVAPWSWAVDWAFNVGDVLHNISAWAAYGLTMPYGYMMETSTVTDTYTLSDAGIQSWPLGKKLPPLIVSTTVKKRIPANPFGFGKTWDGLSPFQISILAALGINRGSRR